MQRQSAWQKRHLATLSTHVKISQAAEFKAACRATGSRPYRVLRRFVLHYIKEHCPKNGTEEEARS